MFFLSEKGSILIKKADRRRQQSIQEVYEREANGIQVDVASTCRSLDQQIQVDKPAKRGYHFFLFFDR